jgi:signal transduction histidine kinase
VRLARKLYFHFLWVLIVVGFLASAIMAGGWRDSVLRGHMERLAAHVAGLVGEQMGDAALRRARVERIAHELELDITLRAPSGRVLDQAGRALAPLAGDDLARASRGPVWLGRSWVAAAPVRVGDELRGVVEVGPRQPVRTALWRMALYVGLVLFAVAVLVAPLARRLSRPIERLTAATRRFGAGDLSARVEPSRRHKKRHRRRRDCDDDRRGRHRHGDEIEDLTRAWNEMAARIESLVRGQKELLANVSHELRTPLARVRVALELVPKTPEAERRVAAIEADLVELEALIEAVLTASRLDAGALPVNPEPVAAADLFAEVIARSKADAPGAVAIEGPADVVLDADPLLLKRALGNLVENALKYGRPPVTLAARKVRAAAELSVSDDGPGISAGERARVVEPFYRGDRARTPGAAGAAGFGLGLTLVARIVAAHGGTLRIEAARREGALERGCRMVLVLPDGGKGAASAA